MSVKPPLPNPCAHCPWRIANQGKKDDPHGYFTAANLKRLWDGLRTGEAPGMTCHGTDPRPGHGGEDGGGEATHECTGAVVMVTREWLRFQALAKGEPKDTLRAYRREVPRGMTRNGLAELASRLMFGGTPLAREFEKPSPQAVNDPAIGYKAAPWDPSIYERSQL